MRKLVIMALLLLPMSVPGLSAQGLKFSGQTVMIHERTSLDVFGLSHQTFRDGLDIKFRFISYPSAKFGYIMRMTDYKSPTSTWNISFDNRGDSLVVRLNDEGRRSIVQIEVGRDEYHDYVWLPVELRIDSSVDSVYFTFGSKIAGEKLEHSRDTFTPSIQFGLSGHVVDVPSFAIKDLCVGDAYKMFRFPLDEKDGVILHDSSLHKRGTATNPNWMVKEAMEWDHFADISSEKPGGVVYSPLRKSVILYNSDGIESVSIADGTSATRESSTPCPMNILLGTNFLKADTLVAYELNDWKQDNTGVSVTSLNLGSMEWSVLGEDRLNGQMHHHGAFINPVSGGVHFLRRIWQHVFQRGFHSPR